INGNRMLGSEMNGLVVLYMREPLWIGI
nr:hypothetical protein [Tanacetum cinerariifolium]